MQEGISRRSFLSGTAVFGAAATLGLIGCSKADSVSQASEKTIESLANKQVSETIDTDVVIVGAGISGLACAVQSAENGSTVLVLEKGENAGGNGSGVEGIFGVDSPLQSEAGIEIDPVEIISHELSGSQQRVDASLWYELIANSGKNIEWLMEKGVQFNGVVDNYHTGKFDTMHWFNGSFGGGGACYVPQMQAAAEELGAEFRMKTAARELIVDDNGAVKGLYALTSDGSIIKINAKAVILASGGIGFNKELLMRQGWTNNELSRMSVICCPTIEGDGYKLAQSAGAKDFLPHSCDQVFNRVEAYSEISTLGLHEGGPVLWVNQDALRFGNEAMYWINLGAQHAAAKGNRDSYVIYDQSILDSFITDDETAEKVADVLNADNDDLIYSSNSIEDLASHFNLDVNTLVETVAAYNKSCSAGRDNFIGKDPQFMIAIENPPYYIARISYMFVAIDGATYTNIRKEVLDSDLNTIPGLYAVGLDGAMLWRTIYTQDIPGTLMGHNVNSGRVAANSAKVYIESIA